MKKRKIGTLVTATYISTSVKYVLANYKPESPTELEQGMEAATGQKTDMATDSEIEIETEVDPPEEFQFEARTRLQTQQQQQVNEKNKK